MKVLFLSAKGIETHLRLADDTQSLEVGKPVSAQQGQEEMVMKEKEDDLALFHELRRREKERSNLLLHQKPTNFDAPSGLKPDHSCAKIVSLAFPFKTAAEKFLYSENDKSDYDWLLTPPSTPVYPSKEMESQRTVMGQIGISNSCPTALKSRFQLANSQTEPSLRTNASQRRQSTSVENRRATSSNAPNSSVYRSSTPTGRPTLPSRPSTPTSRPILPSNKPSNSPRSSTPTRSTACSSTPISRPSVTSSKSASRYSTPTRQSSVQSSRSSSLTVGGPTTVKNPARWKPSEMPGFTHDVPPNLRTSITERPVSASRGRPGSSTSSRPRRQSCSPSRGRAPHSTTSFNSGSSLHAMNRSQCNQREHVTPIEIGMKMTERVTNMRKLPPPKLDEQHSVLTNSGGKTLSVVESSGFGRSLSKKSIDMALRHMDIKRGIPGNPRPLMTRIPASSIYSIRSDPNTGRTFGALESPHATSSNSSSEPSTSTSSNCHYLDASEAGDEHLESVSTLLST